jgi:hypothetical protein
MPPGLTQFVGRFRMLPIGAGLSEECAEAVEKVGYDHHPTKALDGFISGEFQKSHKL